MCGSGSVIILNADKKAPAILRWRSLGLIFRNSAGA